MHIPALTINPRLPVDDSILLPGAIIIEAETSKKINDVAMQQLAQLQLGTFFLKDGSKYTGEHQNNVPHGQGILIYSEGNKEKRLTYVGEFKNGSPDGKGEVTWISGDLFKGYVEKGQLIEGTFTFARCTIFPEIPCAYFRGTFFDGDHFLTGEYHFVNSDRHWVTHHYKGGRNRGQYDPASDRYSNECSCNDLCVIL